MVSDGPTGRSVRSSETKARSLVRSSEVVGLKRLDSGFWRFVRALWAKEVGTDSRTRRHNDAEFAPRYDP